MAVCYLMPIKWLLPIALLCNQSLQENRMTSKNMHPCFKLTYKLQSLSLMLSTCRQKNQWSDNSTRSPLAEVSYIIVFQLSVYSSKDRILHELTWFLLCLVSNHGWNLTYYLVKSFLLIIKLIVRSLWWSIYCLL